MAARDVASAAHAELGIDGTSEIAVDGVDEAPSALERIAADQGLAAADLAGVRFGG